MITVRGDVLCFIKCPECDSSDVVPCRVTKKFRRPVDDQTHMRCERCEYTAKKWRFTRIEKLIYETPQEKGQATP